ncbi:hypothetical protein ACROYT_G036001 [Oculina patagonica]
MEADHRFARVAQDPRFKKISRKERKLKIDGRFQKMFTDKNFTTKYFVDKRGSKVKKTSTEDLHKFYEMSDESDKEEDGKELQLEKKREKDSIGGNVNAKRKAKKEGKVIKKDSKKVKRKENLQKHESTSSDEEGAEENISNIKQTKQTKGRQQDDIEMSSEEEVDISRGEGDIQSSSDEEDEENIRIEITQEDIEHPWGEMDTSTKTTETATRRLAICNLDWDRVTATDLYVLFNSFKPRDGIIESVKIYPSQYGLEQMGKEESRGPVNLKDDDSEKEEMDDNTNMEGSEFSMEKLRQYQLNRLKYYYAVMECNSAATAEVLYEECDGTEFELSGNVLDLRYIPDDMEFEQEAHSVATELPASGLYKAPEFSTTALHQTNVKLTWDETDPGRQRTTMRKFNKDDLLEMDFNAYLASSSDEDESQQQGENKNGDHELSEDEDKKIDKYKELLKEIEDKERKSDRDQELEITWEPGLRETTEDLVTSKMKEKEKKQMTPWESYLQNKKEKRKEKRKEKEASKNDSTARDPDESDEIPSDVDLSDPFFSQELDAGISDNSKTNKASTGKTKKKRKQTVQETEEDRKAKEELELLLMDEKDDRRHFSLKGIMENEKKSKKKRKRKAKDEEIVDDNFNVDLEDSRFDALFTSHHFAVDPSDPQYRKTKAMETIIEERQKRREKSEDKNTQKRHEKGDQCQKRDPSLSLLVKSVKSKTGQFHEQKKKKKIKHT